MLTLDQKYDAFSLSLCLGLLDLVKRRSEPKSSVANRIKSAEVVVQRCLDHVRLEKFDEDDLRVAGKIFDLLEIEVVRYFNGHYYLEVLRNVSYRRDPDRMVSERFYQ